MKTLALLAQKGGTGKTTLAVHLSVISALEGKNTVLVDLDPQRSAADWWEERTAEVPALVTAEAGDLPDLVAAAKSEQVDIVVIDTAPHAQEASAMAAKVADLVLIATRPAILDLRAIGASVEIVQKMKAKAVIVLNSCPPRRGLGEATITREARQGLAAYDLPICPIAITQRVALSHALIDGRAVVEFDPKGKAAAEMKALWVWIQEA